MGHHEAPRRRQAGEDIVADTAGAAAIEQGRRLFAQACAFVAFAAKSAELPPASLPEIAFAGRSNVGKSSLLNALTGRRGLARTSRTPGRTQAAIFFALGQRLMLVDLPGYGHAAAPGRRRAAWGALAEHYVLRRGVLRRVCVLIDARRGIGPLDRHLIDALEDAGAAYQVVLTKADKTAAGALARMLGELHAALAEHPQAVAGPIATSARTGSGLAELRASLARVAEPP
ncbi:MAG: YihA family ribosome biogenesis GTP-binding protein [Alphaproteobacteria bacterium]|nr:YihA family ribosome biogenesis GTP-binding protein [Alphaproteobacteria bacterium]